MLKKFELKTESLLLVTSYSLLVTVLVLSGCVVRTYPLTKDRVDQDLTAGNQGYLQGQAPQGEVKERKATRTTQVVEVELRSPIKFERMPQRIVTETKETIEPSEDQTVWGNRGFITQSEIPETTEAKTSTEKYTVKKGDTLQKISKKFYGTSRKWAKIYEANKDVLKGPNKIYPGQTINIPVEGLKEIKGNLK